MAAIREIDLLIENATIVTMDPDRRVIAPGYVAITGQDIVEVGAQDDCHIDRAHRRVDASGCAVVPGFINAHTHGIHNLLRGGLSDDRVLYDWLLNVLYPGVLAYTAEDAETAAALFCLESFRSGVTTVIDNADLGRFDHLVDATISTYARLGIRAAYARMFSDHAPAELDAYAEAIEAKEPEVRHDPEPIEDTAAALAHTEELIKRYHGTADGRIQIWPSPGIAIFCTRDGLLGAKALAERYGTMLTIHVAESSFDRLQHGVSSIEYLASIGFLGPEVLAAHCVQVEVNDIRMLQVLDVKVANNPVSNFFLGSGIAPIAEMQTAGITVGIGTDDCNCNTSVNMLADMKVAALAQKGRYRHSAAITAEKVLEMATIDGARAIGREHDLGSLEAGKKADVAIIELDHPHMVPLHSVASALVYQSSGQEVRDLVIDGNLVMCNRVVTGLEGPRERELLLAAQAASDRVVERAGLHAMRDRGWMSARSV